VNAPEGFLMMMNMILNGCGKNKKVYDNFSM